MRLKIIEHGRSLVNKLKLGMIRLMARVRVPDVLRVMVYRPAFFGTPYTAWTQAVMRGPSEWNIGERELFAAFTSHTNQCRYCVGHHRATSSEVFGNERFVQAALDDWHTAPIDAKTKVMLGFLEKLTREPQNVNTADIAPLRAAGLSDGAIEDAIHVCASFNIINRIADALDFELPTPVGLARSTEILLTRGYQ